MGSKKRLWKRVNERVPSVSSRGHAIGEDNARRSRRVSSEYFSPEDAAGWQGYKAGLDSEHGGGGSMQYSIS